jgi:glycosyltransferase involved in cell wall biosynthesis
MKILEAAALGVPFITTSVGVEGLKFSHLESCLIADTPEEFATALTSLMNSEELRQKLTENAAKVFEENYSVKSLSEIRNKVYYKEVVL